MGTTLWEYRLERIEFDGINHAESVFNDLGAQGWELVTCYNGEAIFKREKIWRPVASELLTEEQSIEPSGSSH